jgi:hypothetical protein
MDRKEAIIANAAGTEPGSAPEDFGLGVYALLAALFVGVCLFVYAPALDGPFVSDDNHYIKHNSYVHELSLENVLTILDPFGQATISIVNYSPTQLLIHALAWSAFGDDVTGHHVVNIVFHALASLLLVSLLRRCGVGETAALFGGAFFLLHPANVEAVAWISQLKSSSGLVLSLAALIAFPRHRAIGTSFFVAALLAKANAAFALPVAAVMAWTSREAFPWKWLGVWLLVFVAFSIAEMTVHQRSGAADAVLHETPWVLLRTMMGLATRYLVMGASSWGVSAFHEPEPAYALGDPWFVGSLFALGVLGWRSVAVARSRQVEVAFWLWALVSFGPVSQIFPFLYPLADRYLYFILPGLLGATLLATRRFFPGALSEFRAWTSLGRVVALACVIVLVAMGLHSQQRAGIWRSATLLLADAARHYPDGVSANLLGAKRAAQSGDVDTAVAALRRAHQRGFNRFEQLARDPSLAPIAEHARFKAVISEIALGWIESIATRAEPSQGELRMVARAHVVREEYREASEVLRRALEIGGKLDAQLRRDLEALAVYLR